MICEVVITEKHVDAEPLPSFEWEEGVPGILEIWVDHLDGNKACLILDRAFLNLMIEAMEQSEETEPAESKG